MSERKSTGQGGPAWPGLALLAVAATGALAAARAAHGPLDAPVSTEPRVAVGKCLSEPGLLSSPGTLQPFVRVHTGDVLHSRDLLVAIPGFKVNVAPTGGRVRLTLWGNLPGLSE